MPKITIPTERIKVPYGSIGTVSVYIGSSQTDEKDFSNHLDIYTLFKERNVKGFCKLVLYGVENDDRENYIKIRNHVKAFVEQKLFKKYIIVDVEVNTETEQTIVTCFGVGHKQSERLTDSASYTYTDTPSNEIISDLASGIINVKENEDLGKITQTWSFSNMLDATTQVVNYFGGVWWISHDFPYDTDYLNVKRHKGSLASKVAFYSDGNNANIYDSELIIDRENFANSVTIMNEDNTINATVSAVSAIYDRLASETYYDSGNNILYIQLFDASDFPSKGILALGDERCPYDSISGNGFAVVREITASGNKKHRKNLLVFLTYDGSSDQDTALGGDIDDSATTIPVTSTTGFASSGQIIIGGEVISYTGKTSTTFTGCTRGVVGNATAHDVSVVVFQYDSSHHYTTSSPQSGSSIDKWGLKEKRLVDVDISAESTEEMLASTIVEAALEELSDDKGGLASIKFKVSEPIQFAQDLDIDDTIYVKDIDNDVSHDLRIISMELSETEEYGMNLTIEAGSRKRTFVNELISKMQTKYG